MTKRQTKIRKTLNRQPKIEIHEHHLKPGGENQELRKRWVFPVPLMDYDCYKLNISMFNADKVIP